jgi:hypothetical protein
MDRLLRLVTTLSPPKLFLLFSATLLLLPSLRHRSWFADTSPPHLHL